MIHVANALVALVVALHPYFLALEMFLWTRPAGVFGAISVSRKILFVQALPAAIALILLYLT
jgi:uncharacterized membrane protein